MPRDAFAMLVVLVLLFGWPLLVRPEVFYNDLREIVRQIAQHRRMNNPSRRRRQRWDRWITVTGWRKVVLWAVAMILGAVAVVAMVGLIVLVIGMAIVLTIFAMIWAF